MNDKKQMININKNQLPNRRKHYVVKKRFQILFTLSFLILGLIVGIGILEGFWYVATKEINTQLYRTHFMPSDPWEVVFPILFKTTIVFLILLIVTSTMFAHIIFRQLSLKFKTFCETLEKISSGDLSVPISLEKANSLMEQLEETRINLRHIMIALQGTHKEIKHLASLPKYDGKVLEDLKNFSIKFKSKLLQLCNQAHWNG